MEPRLDRLGNVIDFMLVITSKHHYISLSFLQHIFQKIIAAIDFLLPRARLVGGENTAFLEEISVPVP